MAETGDRRIVDFLVELADDPNLLDDLDQVLRESGLTRLQQDVLLSRDFTRIYHAIEAEGGVDDRAFFIVIVGFGL